MNLVSAPILAATAAGLGSIGLMNLDLRPKIDKEDVKALDVKDYQKYVKPGDVLVGAETTPDQAINNYKNEFKKNFIQARKDSNVVDSIRKALVETYPRSIMSKTIDPIHSHLEYVLTPKTVGFIGGEKKKIEDILKSEGAHFIIMRKTEPDPKKSYINDLFNSEAYNRSQTLKSGLMEFLKPKVGKEEKEKSDELQALEKDIRSGNCATLPAIMSEETIGGKSAKTVLPVDYLRSENWKPIGSFGIPPSEIKTSLGNKLLYMAPEMAVQSAVAGVSAGSIYRLAKLFKRLKK